MASTNHTADQSSATVSLTSKPTRQVSDASSSTTEATAEKVPKKLPPIKAPVGLAKGPDLKNCRSKIGSLNNIKHTPTGGGVTIPSQKLKWNAKSKVGSLENKEHKPGGGNLKVETRKLEWKTTSKVQSLQNVHHKPGGGAVKIFNESYVEKSVRPNKQAIKEPNVGSESTIESGPSKSKNEHNNNVVTDNNNHLNNTKPLIKNMKGLNLIG